VNDLNPVIDQLSAIWADVLGAETVEPHDNFFDVGGDSLLALEMATRAREAGLPMPMSAVMRRPVLSDLAAAVLDNRLFVTGS
jgi:mycobactin peptide synthetase MbtE